jgi:hypothetical protein
MHVCLYWQVLDAVHNDINVEIRRKFAVIRHNIAE